MENRYPHYPTTAELYAFEREARRLRAEEMARLIRAATDAVRSVFGTKSKGSSMRKQFAPSFWQRAYARCPGTCVGNISRRCRAPSAGNFSSTT